VADLKVDFAGISSPNPFWLASAPPTNTGEQVMRAFEMGWGGAVWKTLTDPIINVSSRLAGINHHGKRLMGMNNIELSTDRSLEINFAEIAECKRRYPDHVVVASLMGDADNSGPWLDLLKRSEEAGCDAVEINFGCPHGMPERGMGAAIGQVPEYTERITRWVKDAASIPVLVKLTPNVTDVSFIARAAAAGGADALTLINTVASIAAIDLESFTPQPTVGARSSHGGYCGPAVKPIALYQVSRVATSGANLPIGGIGGIGSWRDAAEFILLGATTVQICTAVMHHGYRIIEDLCDGLSNYLDEKGLPDVAALRGKALPRLGAWEELDLNYKVVASIDQERCIGCGVCYPACRDGGHQAIVAAAEEGKTRVTVDEEACVGCNLCSLICPVHDCISMRRVGPDKPPRSWKELQAEQAEQAGG
jgi:dihydropyrimidine dehydrogenase (NAD+) subunit PreA